MGKGNIFEVRGKIKIGSIIIPSSNYIWAYSERSDVYDMRQSDEEREETLQNCRLQSEEPLPVPSQASILILNFDSFQPWILP